MPGDLRLGVADLVGRFDPLFAPFGGRLEACWDQYPAHNWGDSLLGLCCCYAVVVVVRSLSDTMSRIEDTRRTGNDEGSSFSSRTAESPFRTNSTREGPISQLDGASPLDDDGAARPIYPASLANGDTHSSSSPTSPDDDYFSNCALSRWVALQWDDDPPLTAQGGVQST